MARDSMHKPKAQKRVGLHYTRVSASSPLEEIQLSPTKFQNRRPSWESWARLLYPEPELQGLWVLYPSGRVPQRRRLLIDFRTCNRSIPAVEPFRNVRDRVAVEC